MSHGPPGEPSEGNARDESLSPPARSSAAPRSRVAKPRPRLIVFARVPVAGKVKTRLIPALGPEGAAAVHRRLVLRTMRTALAAAAAAAAAGRDRSIEVEIRVADDDAPCGRMTQWLGDGFGDGSDCRESGEGFGGGDEADGRAWRCRPQSPGDLGQRLAGAVTDSVDEGSPATVVIGSDCPALTPEVLVSAFAALERHDVVLGPATDGGYYLIGVNRRVPGLFEGMAWGTDQVLAQTLRILKRTGLEPALLPSLEDLDRPEDLAGWRSRVAEEESDLSRVSVVIPVVNEAAHLPATLRAVWTGAPHEVIVVDGGSTDGTRALAAGAGATVIVSPPGRARQMNAGAARATGAVLIFLHGDTVLPADWQEVVRETLRRPGVVSGAFSFGLSSTFRGRWLVEWTANLRSRWGQSPYGDQTLFLRRALFEELGGFADLPILEDYELNQRLRRRGRMATARAVALTSGRRWEKLGFFRTTWINKAMIIGYRLGISVDRLAKVYRKPRG